MSHIVELMDRKAMTSITNVSRRAPAALVASLILGLTGCGGSASAAADGTYYTQDINNSGDLGQLVVEGGKLTHHEYTCEGVYEEPDVTSTGEFTEDGAQIVWTVAGSDRRNERTGTESVTTSDTSITIGDKVYVRDDSDAGRTRLDAFKASCEGEPSSEQAQPAPIEAGIYYSLNQEGGVLVELTVTGLAATFRQVSCENSEREMRETEASGTLSGDELVWDDASRAPARLTSKDGVVHMQDRYFEPEDYAPATDSRAADGLQAFEEACGAPFPRP